MSMVKKSLKGSIVVNVKVAQNLCGASPKISSCQVNAVSRWKIKSQKVVYNIFGEQGMA